MKSGIDDANLCYRGQGAPADYSNSDILRDDE